jgi:thiamine kinase-like enzyme
MRFIKLGLISVVVLVVLASAFSLVIPSTVIVSRAVDIRSYKQPVYQLVGNLDQWRNWVEGMNSDAVKVFSSDSAQLAKTTVVVQQRTDSTIISKWSNASAADQVSTIRLIADSSNKIVVVQWQFVQQVKWYPWEKISSMMNDKIIGTMIEKNLATLKQVVETGRPE